MKRLLILVLALLLCGCQTLPAETQAPTAEPTQVMETQPAGCYFPGSQLENGTEGALRVYDVGIENGYEIAPLGENLLLLSGQENTTLTLFSGENLVEIGEVHLECYVSQEEHLLSTGPKGIAYFDQNRWEVVFLDRQLKELRRVEMPQQLQNTPVISQDWKHIYYADQESLYVLELETGLQKLLRESLYPGQVPIALYPNHILACKAEAEEGDWQMVFLDAETGILLEQSSLSDGLWGNQQMYFFQKAGDFIPQFLTGDWEGSVRMFLPKYPEGSTYFLDGGVLQLDHQESDVMTQAAWYDLEEGRLMAELEICQPFYAWSSFRQASADRIWMLTVVDQFDKAMICSWDWKASAVPDGGSCLGAYHTESDPDLAGIEALETRADALEEQFDVEICLYQEATQVQPWDYILTPEYRVPNLSKGLSVLEKALSHYPENFLAQTGESSNNGTVTICLVDAILPAEGAGALDNAIGLQFWDDDGNAYIALDLQYSMEQTVYHELCHVIDSRVFVQCAAYDSWESLNPKGFQYDYDYTSNLGRDAEGYLEEADRAFIDTYSMSYPKEDRARIMEYAMMPGCETYFTSSIMQKKLTRISKAIRESYDLEGSGYLWEQYLNEPITD